MNIFTQMSRRFMSTLGDYNVMREIGARVIDVEKALATTRADRETLKRVAEAPAAQLSLLSQLYEHFNQYRNDLNRYESLKTNYLVLAMIETLSYDVLALDPTTEKSFDITIDGRFAQSQYANRIVNDFRARISLDTFVSKVLFDAIFYGQYWFEYLRDDKQHIIGLKDSYQPGSVFTVGLEGLDSHPLYYKISTERVNTLDILDVHNMACMDMQSDRMRFSISSQQITLQSRDATIAQTGNVGRPFCFDIYDKLVSLEMLEQLNLASISSSLQRNSLISVTLPDGLDLEQLKEATAWYENAINNNDAAETTGSYDIETIKLYAAEATKLRVIPQQSQRGAISEALSATTSVENLPDRINDMRNLILDTKGIPSEFIFSGREGSTGDSLRKYVRYARIVKYMQSGLRRFLTKVVRDLLDSYGVHVRPDDVIVKQYCAVNVAELDRLEYMDASAEVIDKIYETVNTLTQDPQVLPYVNATAKARFIESLMDTIAGATQIINVPKESETEVDKDMEGKPIKPSKKED